jgi:hypothetical protein
MTKWTSSFKKSLSPERSSFSSDADTIDFFLTMADSSGSCGLVVQPTHAMVLLFAEDAAHYLLASCSLAFTETWKRNYSQPKNRLDGSPKNTHVIDTILF